MNVRDAARVLDEMSEEASGKEKIALVVASEFIRRVLSAKSAVLTLAKAVSESENLNQRSLFDE